MTLVFMNVYVFYLQKPKISETAVQLKQHKLNSKFPSDDTRQKQHTHDFLSSASAVGLSEQWKP